jgi:hypothetical protein
VRVVRPGRQGDRGGGDILPVLFSLVPALQLLVLQYVEDLRFDDVLYGSSVGMHASAVQILGQIWKKKGLHNYTRDAFTSVTASVQTKEEEGEQK